MDGLTYLRAPTPPTRPQRSPRTPPPNLTTPAAVGSGKRNSNSAQPSVGQTASLSPPANLDSDITLVASENPPTSPSNTPDLVGHISTLEGMHGIAEGNLEAITLRRVLFSHTDKIKIPDLTKADTDPPKETNTMVPRQQSTPILPVVLTPRIELGSLYRASTTHML